VNDTRDLTVFTDTITKAGQELVRNLKNA